MTKQTPQLKPRTHKERRPGTEGTVLERSVEKKTHYENTFIQTYRKFHLQKTEDFQNKNFDIFHISAQNICCGYSLEPPRRGGSNEYPQYMLWAEIRKIMYTPANPSFTIYKWGLRVSKLYRYVFVVYSGALNQFYLHENKDRPEWANARTVSML